MLNWYKELYIGDNAKKDASKVKRKLDHRRPQFGMFLVTYACNPENLLEIIETNQLVQKIVYKRCPMIVGLAADKGEAMGIVQQIIEETYAAQGDVNVRQYLENRLKDSDKTKK